MILIFGPTAVGKTDFSLSLARVISGEIINGDAGQFYDPLTIGTAKPAWRTSDVPHHLFDLFSEPSDYSAFAFRRDCQRVIAEIRGRGHVPIVVGGSGFYLRALLYEPMTPQPLGSCDSLLCAQSDGRSLWEQLQAIDFDRAQQLHPHDTYRLQRALDFWYTYGVKPSKAKPRFAPLEPAHFIMLERATQELRARILARAEDMLLQGWPAEAASLDSAWQTFVIKKKILGYQELLATLDAPRHCLDAIVQRTYTYARRQRTFWRGLKRDIAGLVSYDEVDLTLSDVDLYIKQLVKKEMR